MFKIIFNFELKQHLKKSFTWIFLLLMVAQGLYYMRHSGEFFSADDTYANAPAIIYTVLAGIGYIGFIVTAILGGTALSKDLDYRTSSLVYTTRASESAFFWGRYAGSISVLFMQNAGYLLGIILYSFLPVPNLGPLSWEALMKGIVLIFLPNIFTLYTLCFAVSVFAKSGKAAYGVSFVALLLMIFAETTFENNANVVLADPTAFSVLHLKLLHFSPAEKNSYSPDFSGLLFYNRLIWVGLSAILLILARRKYNFTFFSAWSQKKSRSKEIALPVDQHTATTSVHRKVKQHFSLGSDIKKVLTLSLLEFKTVTRPLGFKLFLSLLLIIYVLYVALWQQQYYSAAPTLPVTLEITSVTLPLSFYFMMFIIINTAELLFKNSSSGFWQIGDSMPLPTWVSVLAKIVAMIGVSMLVIVCLIGFGVLVQTAKGYYNYEFGVYFYDVFIRWMPKYILFILLTVFVAGLTANRYATHWITILFLIFGAIMHEIEIIEQNQFNFSFSPEKNTDMNGAGIFAAAHSWFMWYWFSLSVALMSLGLWLWQRGTPSTLSKRFREAKKFNPVLGTLFICGCFTFIGLGVYIHQTIHVENKFQIKDTERAERALYEKTYKRYEHYPQPKIQQLTLNLDLIPQRRQLSYSAEMNIKNESDLAIDTLHVEWMEFSMIDKLELKGYKLQVVSTDTVLRHTIYHLDHPLDPGTNIIAIVEGKMGYSGFTNGDPQKELTFNGSFLSHNFLPYFGYDDRRELKLNQYRGDYSLKKLASRLPAGDDRVAGKQLYASTQSNRISYVLNITTTGSQRIVAPGVLEKEWVATGRRHYRFRSERPAAFDFHILSAEYNLNTKIVNIGGKQVKIEIYSHPGHPYNIANLISSTQEALSFLHGVLGEYPYRTIRIAERPRYDQELFAYENIVVLPENHGWIADIRKKEDLDYLRYITAKLVAKQYMRQANISRTQGYPVITESIPGYLALTQLEKFYGRESLKGHLQKSHDNYLKGRAKEANREPTLLNSDEEATYVSEEKGSTSLYTLSKTIGQESLNHSISLFLKFSQKSVMPVNPQTFYQSLKNTTPVKYHQSIFETFER
jgi:ABC-type transport system involved in multi-copper enzyme maturation permease subunit